jgi:phosphatidylglycerophosphate synthase
MRAMLSEAIAAPPAPRVVSKVNPANAVTAARFLTLPLFIWAVDSNAPQWATLWMFVCGILDKLDGFAAKVFDCRSEFGEVFDAIADGVCYGFGLIVLVAYGWAPAIPAIAVLLLGAANVVMRSIYAKRAGRAVNYKSYAMERIVGFIAFMIGFATGHMEVEFYYWAFVPLYAVVVLHDAKRMLLDEVTA